MGAPMTERYDVVVVGSGPAGCTAAIYAARGDLRTHVLAGYEAGGQLMLTTEVENFPGYPEGVDGPEMMQQLRAQAERFGATFQDVDLNSIEGTQSPFTLHTDAGTIEARAVILATGSSAKWLGLDDEKRLMGRGISACATCDAFFFKDKEVVIVGGGDSAMEEANFLTKFASKVTIVHRRDSFRASKIMARRALDNPKIEVAWNSTITAIHGEQKVEGVTIQDTQTGETREMACDGYFVAIGHVPNTKFLEGVVDLDDAGYIVPRELDKTYTSVEGIFVAGDVYDHRYKQAITAAGSGCKAAIDAERWLDDQA